MALSKSTIYLPALRGVLGDWVFYSSLMSAKQIATLIKPAKDIREAKSLDEVLQRDLKERRNAIAKYLLHKESRFFNSVVVGVFDTVPDWIEFKFQQSSTYNISDEELAELKSSMGFLVLNGDEQMFAIDGQHRVAGIQIAYAEDSDKESDKRVLNDDQFSIIFVAHIDNDSGRKRTRRLFSDINKNAKPVAEGDKIKIDEDDLNSIVTRKLYANYSHFNGGSLISLTENAKLDEKDTTHFTNLLGLNNVNKVLRKLFKKVIGTNIWDDENVEAFYNVASNFYDFAINNINDIRNYFIDKSLTISTAREGNKYLLFRPIGLKLIAKLYVFYYPRKGGLRKLKSKLKKLSFIMPDSPYNKVLWNNGKMEAKSQNQSLAFELSLYLLDEIPKSREKELLKNYRETLKNDTVKLPTKLK